MQTTSHDVAIELVKTYNGRDFNEADTRHKIIDEILHNVLSWPKQMVKCETHVNIGYTDYQLVNGNDEIQLIIEAKKEGIYFNLPVGFNKDHNSSFIKMETLLTDPNIKSAVLQVQEYASEVGCDFAAITNGHEWIFFKSLSAGGKPWKKNQALVIKKLDFFSENFIEATKILHYEAIQKDKSLYTYLNSSTTTLRALFFPKQKITNYDEVYRQNQYALYFQPIMTNYFGDFHRSESDFIEKCYVDEREYSTAFNGLRNKLRDTLTPFFKHRGVINITEDDGGGQLGQYVEIKLGTLKSEVIVLFGGKGAGKSTFINKLLYHKPPEFLRSHAVICIVNLLTAPKDLSVIRNKIWDELIQTIDVEKILHEERDVLIKRLFFDKFEIAKKQVLYGLLESSPEYNMQLNALVKEWLEDKEYCAIQLSNVLKQNSKGIVFVLDNTDQFEREVQDYCFTVAHEAAEKLGCLTIISMREERFHQSKAHGTLDAFQNAGFHITAPLPEKVFHKRIAYVIGLLSSQENLQKIYPQSLPKAIIDDLIKLFSVFQNEFRRQSELNKFLTACAHSNIRRALELFREFVTSGYTNVTEMIKSDSLWKIQIHQVLKPMMVPERLFYNEELSAIPNIFQVRSPDGSHFTGYRILKKLAESISSSNSIYLEVSRIKNYFIEHFKLTDDFNENLDMLLKYKLIEANNGLDQYSKDLDAIKITTYGLYMIESLCMQFAYLELISIDCGIHDERVAYEIAEYGNNDFKLLIQQKRNERVQERLARVRVFIEYLQVEEGLEKELYKLEDKECYIASEIQSFFQEEEKRVIDSANRNYNVASTNNTSVANSKNGIRRL